MDADTGLEPMEQDDDTLQVQVNNELFELKDESDDDVELVFEETDDLEISEFTKTGDTLSPEEKEDVEVKRTLSSPIEQITISVSQPNDDSKEDGEISEPPSPSDASDGEGGSQQYFSRNSSQRSSRRRNDIRRERSPIARQYPNPYLEMDDSKIQSRAVRFGLVSNATANNADPEKPANISDEELLNLYISCGLIQDDGGILTLDKVAAHHRPDSILIRGTNHMNTNEIFKYLYDLGQKPLTMEWVNDAMCVVIFKDQYEAAISLLKTSKPIIMDPRIVERKRSIVQADDADKTESNEEKTDMMSEDFDYDKFDAIPQSCITVPMPPGYVWRFGIPCDKAKGILVRFATKQDKKQERAERFSEYYKNYGNPNKFGGNNRGNERPRGKKKLRGENLSRSEADEPSIRVAQAAMPDINDKNGWGQLSALWDDEEAFQKSARDRTSLLRQNSKKEAEDPSSGISPLKRPDIERRSPPKLADARDLLQNRKKRKRGSNFSDEDENSDSDNVDNDSITIHDWKEGRSFRRKRSSKVDDEDGEMDWKERLSAPRMRMHADEEEERMKRRAFRRLGHKRGGEGSLQSNSWEFNRESSHNSSFRYNKSSSQRRPISERLGAKHNQQGGGGFNNNEVSRFENDDLENSTEAAGGFDLRQKLVNMRRAGANNEDDEDDLHELIFRGTDD